MNAGSSALLFVVQKHRARALHYDFPISFCFLSASFVKALSLTVVVALVLPLKAGLSTLFPAVN